MKKTRTAITASSPASPEPTGGKADRTRAAILASAIDLFSKQGYAATRLEDVADVVQLTRAALFYYYQDKQTLYDAMLAYAFGPLATRLEEIVGDEEKSVAERIELSLEAWIDAIAGRPALARLILRFVADGTEQPSQVVFINNQQLPVKFWALVQKGRKSGELKPLHDDPFHAASAVVGTSVFYVSALAALLPKGSFKPLDPKQIAAHKQEMLFETRHLLGIKARPKRRR